MKELNENELDQVSGGNIYYSGDQTLYGTKVGRKCPYPSKYDKCIKECFYYEYDWFWRIANCNWKVHH